VEALQEEIVSERWGKANEQPAFPDTDRCVLELHVPPHSVFSYNGDLQLCIFFLFFLDESLSCRPVLSVEYSKVTMDVQETIGACFSSIQLSLENLRNKVKLHDMRGNFSLRHGNEEIEGQMH
jgi:hypothetical protein